MNLNIIKIHYPYIEPAYYDLLYPPLITKGTLSTSIYIFVLVLWRYIKQYFFLKDKNEAFNKKISPGEYVGPGKKTQNIDIAVFLLHNNL